MWFYVYPLREQGRRRARAELLQNAGTLLDVTVSPWPNDPRVLVAKAVDESGREALPNLVGVSVAVRLTLLIDGTEMVPRGGTKSSVARHRQTWLCSSRKLQPSEWPAQRPRGVPGFEDVYDDDLS